MENCWKNNYVSHFYIFLCLIHICSYNITSPVSSLASFFLFRTMKFTRTLAYNNIHNNHEKTILVYEYYMVKILPNFDILKSHGRMIWFIADIGIISTLTLFYDI